MASGLSRVPEIDFLRGIAILMMIVYHFVWDLWYLGTMSADPMAGFWKVFQTITALLFISIVGISLTLSTSIKKRNQMYLAKRGIRVFLYGMIITFGSLIFMPDAFVFFGIIHFIGASIIIASFFVRHKYANLVLGAVTLSAGLLLDKVSLSFPWLVWIWENHAVYTLDLYPLLPWISAVFFGMFIGNLLYPKARRISRLRINRTAERASLPVQYLGKHALLIYFVHLPLVYGLAYLISLF